MAKTLTQKECVDFFKEQVSQMEWCDLAYEIIILEKMIQYGVAKSDNQLELLQLKLKIYEAEKSSRVFKSFDMEYFLNKDMEIFEEDDYDFSDI